MRLNDRFERIEVKNRMTVEAGTGVGQSREIRYVVHEKNPVFKGLLAAFLLLAMGAVFMVGAVTILVWAVRLVQEWVR